LHAQSPCVRSSRLKHHGASRYVRCRTCGSADPSSCSPSVVARRRTAANRDALDRLTACLLEHETVSGDLADLPGWRTGLGREISRNSSGVGRTPTGRTSPQRRAPASRMRRPAQAKALVESTSVTRAFAAKPNTAVHIHAAKMTVRMRRCALLIMAVSQKRGLASDCQAPKRGVERYQLIAAR
jgi:hypothetical protein